MIQWLQLVPLSYTRLVAGNIMMYQEIDYAGLPGFFGRSTNPS